MAEVANYQLQEKIRKERCKFKDEQSKTSEKRKAGFWEKIITYNRFQVFVFGAAVRTFFTA